MEIEPVDAQSFQSVIALLTAAFVDDPVCRYLYPDLRQTRKPEVVYHLHRPTGYQHRQSDAAIGW